MMLFNKIILTFITISTFTLAQVNIEKFSRVEQNKGWEGNLSTYLSAKTGNTDIQEFGIDGRINFKNDQFYSFVIAQGDYGWNKGKEYSNNALLHLRYIHNLKGNIKPEIFGQINYNKRQLLLYRSLIGGGFRFTILSDSISNLVFGTAYMFEFEKIDLENSANHPNNTKHHRWSSFVSYSNSFSQNVFLSSVIYVQPRFDELNDVRILTENHLGVKLTNRLSLSLIFSLRYDSKPPDKVKDLDTNTKIGFNYNF